MNDGGRFRAAPVGERVVTRRGQPLATRIAAIVAVALTVAFSVVIGVAFPFVKSSSIEQARSALGNQADALARFLDGPSLAGSTTIPAQILEILRDHHVTAVLVPPGSAITAPMRASDASSAAHGSVSDVRADASGETVFYEYRGLDGGYGLYATEPEAVADRPTRVLLLKMGYAAFVVALFAMAAVIFYTRRATAPIRGAVSAAERMADGARDVRLVEGGVAEFAALARSMNELSDALANSEDRQRQFLLSVSHELRTPLTALTGYAEALKDGIITCDEAEETGAVMHAEAERLQRLVHDLLDLSRMGAVELRLTPHEIDVRDLVASAAQVWRSRCERENVDFSAEIPQTPVLMTTDAVRLRQIIDNLCENALRVTPEGRPLILALRPAETEVELEVRDGGPGLNDDDLAVAFEPSALHDRYIGIRPVGTGVGLALVGRLSARLGGEASAGRSPEGGAAFRVRLPRRWGPVPGASTSSV